MCIYFLIVITLELYSEIGSTQSVWMEKDISEYNCVCTDVRVCSSREEILLDAKKSSQVEFNRTRNISSGSIDSRVLRIREYVVSLLWTFDCERVRPNERITQLIYSNRKINSSFSHPPFDICSFDRGTIRRKETNRKGSSLLREEQKKKKNRIRSLSSLRYISAKFN